MKILLVLLLLIPISVFANSSELVTCNMPLQMTNREENTVTRPFYSVHGVSITNYSDMPKNYKISFFHEVTNMFGNKMQLSITVNPGQTYVDVRKFESTFLWKAAGQFATKSSTVIMLDGKKVQSCVYNGFIFVV